MRKCVGWIYSDGPGGLAPHQLAESASAKIHEGHQPEYGEIAATSGIVSEGIDHI
jgi:hypothetical protein